MNSPKVKCTGVVKTFDTTTAVKDFNLEVTKGNILSLVGPSGCGKTTVLRLIAGLERPDAGTIEIAGKTMNDHHSFLPPEVRHVGMMFQDYALFPHMDVLKNIGYGLGRDSDGENRLIEVMKLTGIEHLKNQMPHQLSGGEQQRVALARALISEPTVLLLDEPLGALDYNLRQTMMVELKKIQQETGITFIMVTHSQQEAMSMADKVIVMSDAMVQQIGTSREIHENPRNRFVADFIGNNNIFNGVIRSRSGSMAFIEVGHQLYYIRVPEQIRQVPVGQEASFSVRADLMHTGDNPEMANKIEGAYVATEFLGTLETDVFEVSSGHFIHVEQHRHLSNSTFQVGEMETLCFAADSGMLLEETRRPEDAAG